VDSHLQQDVQSKQNLLLLLGSRKCLRRFIVEVLTHALGHVDEVVLPLELGDVDVEQLLIHRRHCLDEDECLLVPELPFGEDEFLEKLQRFPDVCVEADEAVGTRESIESLQNFHPTLTSVDHRRSSSRNPKCTPE
jgi:hypothetical protein